MKTTGYRTGHLLVQLGNAVTWYRNRKMKPTGLTSGQSGMLGYIRRHENEKVTAGMVMKELNLSKPTVSDVLRLLEEKSLVSRHTDASDGRKSILRLTEKYAELEFSLKQAAEQTEEILLQGMTDEEKQQLNRLLCMAMDNMKTAREEERKKDITAEKHGQSIG